LRRLGQSLTDQELNDMVRQADANKDGVIDYSEVRPHHSTAC
jgi:Ca2+-binding EF-hand superfamily protein